ncbi:methionine synthase reductase [Nematostella vectensis]|uniref:methionine synthase reductase n=1 Tax=Nematostella vectensis TaxID=45351 RepID=UPI00207725DE|nr:methionine synthase reductase [Nematostella vectensis]
MPVDNSFTILYASQTGQAKAIADEIHEKSASNGLNSKLFCLSLTEKKFMLEKESAVVFVVSTTGEGDPPDTMLKFFRRLKKKTLPGNHLKDLQYGLLALGDSNYTNFCVNGKNLDRRLNELGAKKFYDTGHADDAVGLELVVEPWIDGLWGPLKDILGVPHDNQMSDRENIDSNKSVVENDSVANGIVPKSENLPQGSSNEHFPEQFENHNEKTSQFLSESEKENSLNIELTVEGKPTLRKSGASLSSSSLSIPVLPSPYLEIKFHPEKTPDFSTVPHQAGASFPGAASPITMATIVGARRLTADDAMKKALEITLDISQSGWEYEAGNSFNIYCPNDEGEVDAIIERLGLTSMAQVPYDIQVMSGTKKKTASIPNYIPQPYTIKESLLTCLDIRMVPRKAFLRTLVEFTHDNNEQRRLQELCSKQGADEYCRFVREPSLSLLELLTAFPSCFPPFERLLEHLPRLSPRPYSISSSPLEKPGQLNFVFNVVEFGEFEDIRKSRKGVCTSWLEGLTGSMITEEGNKANGILKISELSILSSPYVQVPVSARSNSDFKLPPDSRIPVIMIGPGTGVAPFIGFLHHRRKQMELAEDLTGFGEMWLFFGCRHREKDFLYQKELESFVETGTLSRLFTSFSRDQGFTVSLSTPRYVQDNLKLQGDKIADLVLNDGAVVYVCGDAKNMASNVFECFCEIIEKHLCVGKMEAIKEMTRLRKEKKYREDVWT